MSNIKLYEHFYQGQEGDPLDDYGDDDVDDDDYNGVSAGLGHMCPNP